MASIHCQDVYLEYPLSAGRVPFKDYILQGLFRQTLSGKKRMVQALRQINLEIGDGERIGIIGHNGAGKSTLLRTIAGVYPTTRGECVVDGEICSLFDVNVGFEMEATGWKNVYYRSYLQGATPSQVRERARAIGEFTELGSFLDLPLRCYSSGMLIRLAFAIATAREPEILLIDEFFGAGDLAFQRKAELRMQELIGQASIVIMAGHSLEYFQANCQRVLWLEHGAIRADGDPRRVIRDYEASVGVQRLPVPAVA